MASFKLAMLLMVIALAQNAGAETSENSTTDNSSNTTADNSTANSSAAGGIAVKVQGQSGKFTIYNSQLRDLDPNKVVVLMDALREVDASGNAVGTGGSSKHSIQTFAAQDFTIAAPEEVSVGTANATKISFSSPVGSIGQIKVDTLILTEAGKVGPEGEQWNASVGDVKFNIELSSWSWCGCSQGGRVQVGAFIDVEISVKGKQSSPSKKDGKNQTYDLGGGVSMELTSAVSVDGIQTVMPEGFPRLETKGSSQVFVFRFPRFNTSAIYDPLVQTSGSDTALTTTTSTTLSVTRTSGSDTALTTTTSTTLPVTTAAPGGAPSTTVTTTANPYKAGGVSFKVQGQSGKFTTYSTSVGENDPHKVVVSMDALREVDADGTTVGASGSSKHSIQTFAAQDFTIGLPEEVSVGTARATKIGFTSPVGSIGRIKVETLILTKAGMVGPAGGQWNASVGDLKFNIELSSWSWCGCSQGGALEVGAFIDVDISVKGSKSNATEAKSGGSNAYNLGGGVIMDLTNNITVDGIENMMPAGYPRVEMRGSSQVFVFRFPKFTTSAVYDPLLRMSGSESVVPIIDSHAAGLRYGRLLALQALALSAGGMIVSM